MVRNISIYAHTHIVTHRVCVCVMCASDFHFLGSSNDLNLRSKNIYVRSPSAAFHYRLEALQRP